MREHSRAFANSEPHKSATAKNCIESHHHFNNVCASLLHNFQRNPHLKRLEEIETIKLFLDSNSETLNDVQVTYNNPLLRFYI